MIHRLARRWRTPPGQALLEALSSPRPTQIAEIRALCAALEGSTEVASGLDFRGLEGNGAVVFRDVDLRGASFDAARPDPVFTFIGRVDLRGASFEGAKLDRIRLGSRDHKISLRGASFGGASLREAVFRAAMSAEIVLRGADLRRAELAGADLRGADLEGADAREATFGGARFDAATRFAGARLTEGYLDAELAAHAVADGAIVERSPSRRAQALAEIRGTRGRVERDAPEDCRAILLTALRAAEASVVADPDWLAAASSGLAPRCREALEAAFEDHLADLTEEG
jgi:uncharacterized protein YjbI with pentapeptide repeats